MEPRSAIASIVMYYIALLLRSDVTYIGNGVSENIVSLSLHN
ncbi:hypothetical protein [Coleofasciculus sp. FACHB-1120]|nr:hypothetical protein [Coleofasciculus sp. FACHB-1120]